MKRPLLVLLTALLPLGMVACERGPVVVVQATVERPGDQPVAIADLPVELLPFDRDAVFDSLARAYGEPEPEIPPEILQQQQAVQSAQAEWQTAESRWTTVRDSLRTLSNEMQRMQQQGLRGTPQYQQAFRQFEQLEAEERQVRQRMDAAFARFDELQRNVLAQADSVRVVREAWEDRAFAEAPRVFDQMLDRERRSIHADTTGGDGTARLRPRSGRWWVHARYVLPTEELYWNLPIEVTGDSVHVELRRENAEVRPVL